MGGVFYSVVANRRQPKVLKKAATDGAPGRTIVVPVTQAKEIRRLRISPVGVVEEKKNCQYFMT